MSLGRLAVLAAVLAVAFAPVPRAIARAAGPCRLHPWCDRSLPAGTRAARLVRELTPAERIALLAGDRGRGVSRLPSEHSVVADGVPRLGVPSLAFTDGPLGIRQGRNTAFPSSMAVAATFDRGSATAAGGAIGNEARLRGNAVLQAPTVNLLRTPLWGRSFESYGEDPMLSAAMGAAWIRAAQRQGVIAVVKHFAVNNQEGARAPDGTFTGRRFTVNAQVDERTLRELYLPPFEAAARDARAGAVMCAYNRIGGTHACENRALLTDILRREWGFRGFVLADYGASKGIGAGLAAGLDFEPYPFVEQDRGQALTPANVRAAIAAGGTTQAAVDGAVRHLLTTLFAQGLFDRAAPRDTPHRIDRSAHQATAQHIAEAGTVLLRNHRALPLGGPKVRSIAVIGADAQRYVRGGGSAAVEPTSFTSPLDAIASRAGRRVRVRFDPGSDTARAARTARGAGAAVVVVADKASEGSDKPCLALDCGTQDGIARDRLIESVAAANRRTIVVLETAAPVLTPWRSRVAGIVEAWYPGQEAGPAIARVLFGDVDPGGRLPATFPARAADLPTAGDPARYPGVGGTVHYTEGLFVGYRSYDRRRLSPAFPFGFGLSYTRFALGRVGVRGVGRRSGANVSVRVTNRGRRRGTTVVQLYLGLPGAPGRPQPPRQLKGFAKVSLAPGDGATARMGLNARAFSYWNVRRHRWLVARGCYGLWAGQSSRDLGPRTVLAVRGASCGRGAVAPR